MNLLVIDEEFPFPLNTGKRLRSFNLTRGLAEYHDVTYLAYGGPESEAKQRLRHHGITPLNVPPLDRPKSGPKFYCKLLTNLLSTLPYIVTSHFSKAFEKRVRECLESGQYDMVICEWTPYAIFIKDIRSVTSIIVAHNIESSIWKRYETHEPNWLRRLYISIQRARVESFERNAFGWAHGATAVTRTEADMILAMGVPYPVEVIDNGVDLDYYQPSATESDPCHLVFTGSMDWRPNQDAVAYFVEEIYPLIRDQVPETTFTIVGRRPPKRIRSLSNTDGIRVTGTVDDVRPFIAKAAVYVVPLRIGGGSRLKILEAMAMERPVVSTTVGAEGLQVSDGHDIVLADAPASFADAVVGLMQDKEQRRSIARLGRDLVEEKYGWDRLSRKYHQYLCAVAGRA